MAEYIDKQLVIDYLNGYLHSIGSADDSLFNCGQRRALINSIQDLLAVKAADVQPINQWINCKDKMPEDGQPVLFVFNINSDLKAVMYGWHETIKGLGSGWHQAGVGGARCEEDVSHWQPIPEPPKEDK